MSSSCSSTVPRLYDSIMDDVVASVRETFFDEGIDEQVLVDLKTIWRNKVLQTRALQQPTATSSTAARSSTNTPTSGGTVHRSFALAAIEQQQQQQRVGMSIGKQHLMGYPHHAAVQQQQQSHYAQGMHLQLPIHNPTSTPSTSVININRPHESAVQHKPVIMGIKHVSAAMLGEQARREYALQTASGSGMSHHRISQLDGQSHVSDSDDDDNFIDVETTVDDQAQGSVATIGGPASIATIATPSTLVQDEEEDDEPVQEPDHGEPLNSEDDVSDEQDVGELFDTDNIVVCQYDKVNRVRNRWKFQLKDGIMNLRGRDYVFQRASGFADW